MFATKFMQKHFLKKYLAFLFFIFFLFLFPFLQQLFTCTQPPSRSSRVHPCYGVGLIARFHSLFHFALGWWRRISERIVIIHAWRVPQAMVVGVGVGLVGSGCIWWAFDWILTVETTKLCEWQWQRAINLSLLPFQMFWNFSKNLRTHLFAFLMMMQLSK